ncbi:MAG: hypothetical protein PWR03_1531 [Tenuifilum sp.]|nr:hypothetical protein [Tenuifilum sp.]
MELDTNYIKSLIALLDDPDTSVFETVANKIIEEGNEIIPFLEDAWESAHEPIIQNRIEEIIGSIQFNKLKSEFSSWISSPNHDLLEGTLLVSKIQYPELDPKRILEEIENIRRDIWLELNNSLTALEKVKIINHVLFDIYKYKPNTSDYYSPRNYLIKDLVESKKGGAVILTIFYAIISQQLGLPIYCVSIPHNFVLAYEDRYSVDLFEIEFEEERRVLFYINPFSQGSLFSANEIKFFLRQQKIEDNPQYYLPISNYEAIQQLVYNTKIAFQRSNQNARASQLQKIYNLLQDQKPKPIE